MGTLTVITAPTVEPITLSAAKVALRIDHADDDARVNALIKASRIFAEQYTGLYLVPQTLELSMDRFRDREIALGVIPLTAVQSVKYDDTSSPSTEQTLTADVDYYADTTIEGGRLVTITGWPVVDHRPNAVRIRMTAGYPLAGSPETPTTPELIKEGMIMYMKSLYDEAAVLEEAARRILWPHRVL